MSLYSILFPPKKRRHRSLPYVGPIQIAEKGPLCLSLEGFFEEPQERSESKFASKGTNQNSVNPAR